MAANLPVPGILRGSYPQRRQEVLPVPWGAALRSLAGGRYPWARLAYQRFAQGVAQQTKAFEALSASALHEKLQHVRAHLSRDGFTVPLLTDAFAIVSRLAHRELGTAPYPSQIIAARILMECHLAEMATGEGKTLSAAMAASVAATAGIPVHVVTTNDYLVERDANGLRPLYAALGLTVGAVSQSMTSEDRKAAYACNVTYCTGKELVFDYLRDSIADGPPDHSGRPTNAASFQPTSGRVLRGLCMAIVDEADSLFIDEARVPLVLARALPAAQTPTDYAAAWQLSASLVCDQHFRLNAPSRTVELTAAGSQRLHDLAAASPVRWLSTGHRDEAVKTALVARHMLRRDYDYLVVDSRILIIDEHTGRAAEGRAWSRGLHQLLECKEACLPTPPTATLTQITYQRFFSRYWRLCGMSGTLMEAGSELLGVYGLHIKPVPLHRASRRTDLKPRVFQDSQAMWCAAVARVQAIHQQGRPVLVGTDSVKDSETLSLLLSAAHLTHTVLNARQDRQEAQVIAKAGQRGAITIATNMAGRGTDIALGSGVAALGGLHILSCQQNVSRRVDRQLLGRCARQGDPGSTERFIALDGPLLAQTWQSRVLRALLPLALPFQARLASLALGWAQYARARRLRFERKILQQRDKEIAQWFSYSGKEG